jgi:hypothetical protein
MPKRLPIGWISLSFISALLIAAALLTIWQAAGRKEGITDTTYKQLHRGMTLKEVENLFGGPPGDYGPGKGTALPSGSFDGAYDGFVPGCDARWNGTLWLGEDIAVSICFDTQGRVSQVSQWPVYRKDTLLDPVLRRIGLKKPRRIGFQ